MRSSSAEPAAPKTADSEQAETQSAQPAPAESEPAAAQPAAVQPASTQPAAAQPTSAQPASTRPASTQPASTQPAAPQPAAVQPASAEAAASTAKSEEKQNEKEVMPAPPEEKASEAPAGNGVNGVGEPRVVPPAVKPVVIPPPDAPGGVKVPTPGEEGPPSSPEGFSKSKFGKIKDKDKKDKKRRKKDPGDRRDIEREFELPQTSVAKILKRRLEEGVNISKEAKQAFSKSAGIFILYLTAAANEYRKDCNRQTLTAKDIFEGLRAIQYGDFIDPLRDCLSGKFGAKELLIDLTTKCIAQLSEQEKKKAAKRGDDVEMADGDDHKPLSSPEKKKGRPRTKLTNVKGKKDDMEKDDTNQDQPAEGETGEPPCKVQKTSNVEGSKSPSSAAQTVAETPSTTVATTPPAAPASTPSVPAADVKVAETTSEDQMEVDKAQPGTNIPPDVETTG